jgi:hypothetical protein
MNLRTHLQNAAGNVSGAPQWAVLADVPQMTCSAGIKMPLWRFIDKMDGEWCAPDASEQGFRACTLARP